MRFIAVAGIAALVLSGCAKKEKGDGFDSLSKDAPQAAKKAADLFDEFYMDDEKPAAKKGESAAPPPPPPPSRPATAGRASASGAYSFNPSGRYVVQVTTTALQGGAERTAAKLKAKGWPAYIAEVENPTPELTGLYFRVRIGGFDGLSEAKAFAETALRPEGYDYWVDRKANDNVGIRGAGFGSGGSQQQYQPAPAAAPAPAPIAAPAPQPAPAPAPAAAPAPQPAPAKAAPAPAQGQPAGDWGNTQVDEWGADDW
jgi:hypothetical protein